MLAQRCPFRLAQRGIPPLAQRGKCKVGLRWANVLAQRWPNVGVFLIRNEPTLGQLTLRWANVVPMLGGCWNNVGPT